MTRRLSLIVTIAAASVLAPAIARAQAQPSAPPAQQPAAPAQTPPPAPAAPGAPAPGGAASAAAAKAAPLVLTGDAAVVLFTVKTEGAADFEAFFAKVKDALSKSDKPQHKDMAAHWTLFKVSEVPQAGQVLYAGVIDPAVAGADYDPVKILGELSPADATALYPKLKDALLGVNRMNLQTALKMGQ